MPAYAILILAYVLSQFYRSFLAVMVGILEADIGATASDLSRASGALFLVFALMQFPIGYALDRFGPRRTTALLLAVAGGSGAALFAIAQGAGQLMIAMGLIGAGCAPVLMAAFFLFAHNHPPARFATLGSTFIAIGTIGNIFSTQPLAAAIEAFGWREVAWALCFITVLAGIGVWLTMRDPPRTAFAGIGQGGFLALFKIPQLWPVFPCILLGYSVAAGIRGLWAGPLLADVYGLDTLGIGQQTFFMAAALSLGSLAYGPLDRWFDSRKYVVMAGNAMVAVSVGWLALFPPQAMWLASFLLVMIGFFGSSFAVQLAHGKAFIPAHLMGRGVTLMNFFAIGGAGMMQFVSGYVVAANTLPQDPLAAYRALFTFYTLTLAVALAIYLFSADAPPSKA